ncbi:MAG TPA: aldolase/citrate lyase family protein [Geminicoccaceae bacterium]|nr:aldolase/citrate lyase family protein [Geminicoccus sp.]HMU48540.1 aldolase/citrate lyase family protein [Geminicoccaceae bacterium]
MPARINQAIARLEQGWAIYYVGDHCGHVLTYEQGLADAATWADYINVGMEHGAFDMTGLAAYLRGLGAGGPTAAGYRMPAVLVEAPVGGTDEGIVRANAWQFRQILAQGVHGILLCQAESPDAVRAFVESCRYPHQLAGVDPRLPSPAERMDGARTRSPGRAPDGRRQLGVGTRGRGSESTVAEVWGIPAAEILQRADTWPLNTAGELLLGVKIESPEGVANCEEILAVPGLGFAEIGPGDLGLSLGYTSLRVDPYPPEMQRARDRILAACRANELAFLELCSPDNIVARIDEGVRIVAGHSEQTARIGRAHQQQSRRSGDG